MNIPKFTPPPLINQIVFDMDLENGLMNVTVDYVKDDAVGSSFLLN